LPFLRWWAPAGDAVNVPFYRDVARQPGQTVWFYHAGQPFVGNHSINQSGIDLRLWPLLCARDGLHGFFIWSLMAFPFGFADARNPYDAPGYKLDDTRWGNGVWFYPGSRLTQAGYARNMAGPVASMRLKALRRGLQDAEYAWLLREKGSDAEVRAQLRKLIPRAFGEARAKQPADWSTRAADYENLRLWMAQRLGGQ
jgi:hypothetical protein